MNVVFFEDNKRVNFLPLAYTKPVSKIRVGILTIEDKWKHHFKNNDIEVTVSYITQDYLAKKYPLLEQNENIFINARFFPNKRLVDFIINNLIADEAIFHNGTLIAAKCNLQQFTSESYYIKDNNESFISIELKTVTDIFSKNEEALIQDYQLITSGRKSQPI